ncbi:MAG: epoxyqueuosine reductase QueH [Bacilli bacterium]|nr:epoxyqueuosine reductase QueH [Bacilli bacterium]
MMKENYQLRLDEILKNLDEPKKLLLHSCCAPCSSYVIEYLSNYFYITVLYYNPNIEPIEEYEKRKAEEVRFIKEFKTKYPVNMIDSDYDNSKYHEVIKGLEMEPEGGARCSKCFVLRMEKAAQVAKDNDYDYFGTTLTVSPYKNSQILNNIGKSLEEKYNVKYLYSDFKKREGYKRSIELSKIYNLYRQHYCGCLYSKENEVSD